MKTIVIISLLVVLLAYITGCVIRSWFNIKYISYNIPVGFFLMLGIIEYLFFFVSFFKLENKFYVYLLILYIVVICLLFVLRIKSIIPIIKEECKNKIEIMFAFLSTALFLFLFSKININYMNEDIIFYNKLIYDRMQLNSITITEGYYISQHYYSFFSAIISFFTVLLNKIMYVDFPVLGYYLWIPTIVLFIIVPLQIMDLKNILIKRFSKRSTFFILILLIVFVFSDEWMFAGGMYGNTMRRFILAMLLIVMGNYLNSKENGYMFIGFLLSGAMIAASSSSLFILLALLVCFIIGNAFLDKQKYLGLVLLIAIPCLFTSFYIMRGLTYIVALALLLGLILQVTDKLYFVEKLIRKFRYILILIIPLSFILLGFYSPNQTLTNFFNEMNIDNLRPHLNYINFNSNAVLSFRNILFWIIVIICALKLIKEKNGIYVYLLTLVICFYNPFVYQGVSLSLTKANYFRLNDLIYNILFFLICIIILFKSKRYRKIKITMLVLICIFNWGTAFLWLKNRIIDLVEYNVLYKIPYKEIEVIEELKNKYLIEDRKYIVGSHILGIEMYTNYKFINPLSRCPDPIQLSLINKNQYDVIFYPQQYYQFSTDYTFACAVAKQNDLEYFIENAQYDWMIEEYLWPCAIQQFELNNYRVWKLDYNLWDYNVESGLVPDTREIPD